MAAQVSVCVPTFNGGKFVGDALKCACEQTFKDIEIIVVDDGSTDGTVDICRQAAPADRRVSIHVNDTHLGLFGNLSRCVELARGTYVKLLMQDDMLEPACLERMLSVFKKYPTVKIVGCSQQNRNEQGRIIRQVAPYSKSCLVPGRRVLKDLLLKMSNDIGAPTSVLMRKADFGRGFNRSFFFMGDFEMWARALLCGDYYFLNEPLSVLRLHGKSGTATNFKTLVFLNDILQLRDMYADFMEGEGVSKERWGQIIDHHIISYIDHIMLEGQLAAGEVPAYAERLIAIAGDDGVEHLVRAMSSLLYYTCSRMHTLNIEARWNQGQVQNLEREIDLMTKTIVWKMAAPLRAIRNKLGC